MAYRTGAELAPRDAKGRLTKGAALNPGGRPRKLTDVTALAQAGTEVAIKTLLEVTRSARTPAAARVSAAVALLDRGWGRPMQRQEIEVRADLPTALEAMRNAAPADA